VAPALGLVASNIHIVKIRPRLLSTSPCWSDCSQPTSWNWSFQRLVDNQSQLVRAVPAWLGPKAPALAWPERAPALNIVRPSQSHKVRPGSGLAWPRPGLLYEEYDTQVYYGPNDGTHLGFKSFDSNPPRPVIQDSLYLHIRYGEIRLRHVVGERQKLSASLKIRHLSRYPSAQQAPHLHPQ
jgi:hypothetical protein